MLFILHESIDLSKDKEKRKDIKAIKTVESKNKYKLKEDRILHLDIQKKNIAKSILIYSCYLKWRQLVLLITFTAYMMSSEKSDAWDSSKDDESNE